MVVMGVSGSGKTTVGSLLAREVGWLFVDADSLHPAANIEKMRSGQALSDEDRLPWLAALKASVLEWLSGGVNVVLACSALKESYRESLAAAPQSVSFVYLKAPFDTIESRLALRQRHFMGPGLLKSQFEALEEPVSALTLDAERPPGQLVAQIRRELSI